MEEFISSLLKGIKERNRSGFWFTFVLSWCVINWKIIILIFFEPKESFGKHSLLDSIQIFNPSFNTGCAFLIAIGITAIMPWLHTSIAYYNRLVLRRKESLILKAENYNGPIDPTRFIANLKMLEEEKTRNQTARIEFQDLTIKVDQLESEKQFNFEDYKKSKIDPIIERNRELMDKEFELHEKMHKLRIEFHLFPEKLEINCKVIENEINGENLNDFLIPFTKSKYEIEDMVKKMANRENIIFTIDSNEITISKNTFKILGYKLFDEGNLSCKKVFLENTFKERKTAFSMINFYLINGYYFIVYFGYFERPISVPVILVGKTF